MLGLLEPTDGTFTEEAVLRGLAYNAMGKAQADMGIAMGDVDGDGLFDLFVTHLTDELHVFWRQGPRGQFLDQTAAVGLVAAKWRSTGFGAVMGDFNHDGAPDLAQVNVMPSMSTLRISTLGPSRNRCRERPAPGAGARAGVRRRS